MITVKEASGIILNNTINLTRETVTLDQSLGRVLAEKITADRDFPPFDRVTMDGIAINYDVFRNGQRKYAIEGRHMAGNPGISLKETTNCLEVMTGAILPAGTDTVIRYEDLEISNGSALVTIEEIRDRQNVHKQGTDRANNDRLISPGTLISPAEIGVLATVGKTEVQVRKAPKIAIISTGDELVDIGDKPEPHQIRKSNVHNLQEALNLYKCPAELFHIADNKADTIRRIAEITEQFDVLMLSGGVSKGKADHVPEALEDLGFEKLFHRIKQRPGKPFWFGRKEEKVVFAFPGNPVSTFVCYQNYFRPWLERSLGLNGRKDQFAALAEDFFFKPELTYFLQVQTYSDEQTGRLMAKPVEGHGSGDLANLLNSDAFLQLPSDRNQFKGGEVFPLIPFKNL